MWHQTFQAPELPALLERQGLRILPGLNAVTGDEGTGKTRLLRELAAHTPGALWLDLRLPEHDPDTPLHIWSALQARHPHWQPDWQVALAEALGLQEHLGKSLSMLSTGSRRKVGLVALLASGAPLTCIDQPYASLDMASVRVLREFLQDMAEHPSRAWVVADYEADAELPWRSVVHCA
jgi:ABC-type transport system involved in cytochrome c biogenesis ATPase subunit